jgi:hypothetical protein
MPFNFARRNFTRRKLAQTFVVKRVERLEQSGANAVDQMTVFRKFFCEFRLKIKSFIVDRKRSLPT